MRTFPIVWSNLKRKKFRTVLTLLSIIVAFVLFGFLSAVKHAMTGGISVAGANRLIVRHKVSIIQLLPESYKARMLRIPGVAAATHQTWFGGIYQDPKNFFMQSAVVPEEFLAMFPELLLTDAEKQAWFRTRTGAIIGRSTADRFKWKVGSHISLQVPIWGMADGSHTWEFDVVGIYGGRDAGTDTSAMFFRYDYFDETRRNEKGQVGWYTIRIENPADAADVARRVDAEFENSRAETKAEPEGAFVQAWVSQIGNIALMTTSILGAVFFTILLVTGNTMSQSVRERTGELGVLKAIGFTNVQVLGMILGESCLLAVMGGVIGLGIARLLTASGDPTGGMLPMYQFPIADMLVGLGLSIVLGLVTGVLPALQAMRLRVADALRRM